MTSVRLSTDSKASTSSLGSLPSLPDTHSFTPAQDRLEYLTKMISSLDTEMYQLSVSSVKLKANAAAEETMENMRACTNHIEDSAHKCTESWTRLSEGAPAAVRDGRAKVTADVDQLCMNLGLITNKYVEKWRSEQAVEALKRRAVIRRLRKVCWIEKCSIIDDDKGSSRQAWITEFGVDPNRKSIELDEEEHTISHGDALNMPIGSVTYKAILQEINTQYNKGVEIQALKIEITELRAREEELMAQLSEVEEKAKKERETAQLEQAGLRLQLESQYETAKIQLDTAKEILLSQINQFEDKTKLDFKGLKTNIEQLEREKADLSNETINLKNEVKAVVELSEKQKATIAHLEGSLALYKTEVRKDNPVPQALKKDRIIIRKENRGEATTLKEQFTTEGLNPSMAANMELLKANEFLTSGVTACYLCKARYKALQEVRKFEQPLIRVGIAIRRGFIEQAKQGCANKAGGLEEVYDKDIVDIGLKAARNADVLADISLFRLGYVDPTEAATAAMKFVYRDVFEGNPIDYFIQFKEPDFSIEIYNMYWTMRLGFGEEFGEKSERFSHFVGLVGEANQLHNTLDLKDFKASPRVEEIVVELRILFHEFMAAPREEEDRKAERKRPESSLRTLFKKHGGEHSRLSSIGQLPRAPGSSVATQGHRRRSNGVAPSSGSGNTVHFREPISSFSAK